MNNPLDEQNPNVDAIFNSEKRKLDDQDIDKSQGHPITIKSYKYNKQFNL